MDGYFLHRTLGGALLCSALLLLLLTPHSAAASCGGANERACCFFERLPSCDPGLIEAAAGEYPSACDGFGAGTCVQPSECGGPGQRGCCNAAGEFSDVSGVCDSRDIAPLEGCVGENCWCSAFGAFFGGKSLHTCVLERATACGGEGQRACCVIEPGAACVEGTEEQLDGFAFDQFISVSGDATCSDGITTDKSLGTCVKDNPANIGEPGSNWTPPVVASGSPMRGYLDMHLHLLADQAHGGRVFVGEPAPRDAEGNFTLSDSYNINTALSPDRDLAMHKSSDHGLFRDTIGDGTKDGSRSEYGAPYFSGWPKWTSTTHQQAYYTWLERAWRGGLRAVSMLAVTNEALCKSTNPQVVWTQCENSMGPVIDQLLAAQKFEAFIDDLADGQINGNGAGEGWFRIVTSPEEARAVISSGKLAVMLGIEVDNLFNCKESGCPADFGLPASATGIDTPATLDEAVDVLYQLGVRHVFPVHNFDNAFGAAATWQDAIGVGQAVVEQRWWDVENCGVGAGDYGFKLNRLVATLLDNLGFADAAPDPVTYPAFPAGTAACNARGMILGDESAPGMGRGLVAALMQRGILIDIDHMSRRSIENMLDLAKTLPGSDAEPYPLIASHVQFFDRYPIFGGNGRHERMRTRAQLEAIRDTGGMIGAMLKDDVQDTDQFGQRFDIAYSQQYGRVINNDCRYSSKSWAQGYMYAVDLMNTPVALGSDFNGIAGHLGPRFGSDACGGWAAENREERSRQEIMSRDLGYPFELPGFGSFDRQQTGFKHFDYNVDGLAHIGLLPDFVADLRVIGVDNHYMDKLFCSAEGFVRVWERAEALAQGEPDPAREWQCDKRDSVPPLTVASVTPAANANGWHNAASVNIQLAATDVGTGVNAIEYRLGEPTIDKGTTAGALVQLSLAQEGIIPLQFSATDFAGNVEPRNNLPIRIDSIPPQIAGAQTPRPNAYGWNNTDIRVQFTCDDVAPETEIAGSGVALADCGPEQLVTELPPGTDFIQVTGIATDLAGNTSEEHIGPVRIDKAPPIINAMAQPAANEAGWNNSDVQVSFACADDLSGILSCAEPALLTDEGSGQEASGIGSDLAENTATTTLGPIAIDKTAPEVTVTGLEADAIYILGDVPLPDCQSSDSLSGIAAEATAQVSGGTSNNVGTFTALCEGALDVAGNPASAAIQYQVHYRFTGFFNPLENPPVRNSARAGQVLPVRFDLAGAHGLDVLPGGHALSVPTSCAGETVNDIPEETESAGNSQLSYDADTGLYQYTWKTDRNWRGTCRTLLLRLDDGSQHRAMFSFR